MDRCRLCGEGFDQSPIGRRRQFCSDECRNRLHSRRRWLTTEQRRLEHDVEWRRQAAAGTKGGMREMHLGFAASLEERLQRIGVELGELASDPART